MPYTVTIDHIDTCLFSYLQDHHKRPGEVLIGVPVSRETARGAVMDALHDEWKLCDYNEDMDYDVFEEIERAFEVAYTDFRLAAIGQHAERTFEPFDEGLDPASAYEGNEAAQAWFLVRYAEADEEEGAAHEPEAASEDEADRAVARARLAEIAMRPESVLRGDELMRRVDAWVRSGWPDRYYFGFVDPDGRRVVTVQRKDQFFGPDLPGCHHIRNHSPSGFAWGYAGSGPAQLALAILCDAVGAVRALPLYQRFKDNVVATWPQEGTWSINYSEVLAHVEIMEAASAGKEGA